MTTHRDTETPRAYLLDPLTESIIGCAIAVHRVLGPGLVEATYEEALCIELRLEGLTFTRQLRVPIEYRGHLIGEYRPDSVGLLLNFNGETLRSGVRRLAI